MQKFYPDTVHRLMHGEVTRLQTPQRLRDAPYPPCACRGSSRRPTSAAASLAHASAVQAEQAWNRRYKERTASGRVATVKVRARTRTRPLLSPLARAARRTRARARPR